VLGHDHETANSQGEDFRMTNCLLTVLSLIPGSKCAVLGVTSRPKAIVPSIGRSWLSAASVPLQHPSDVKNCLRHFIARVGFYQRELDVELPKMGARDIKLFARKAVE